MPLHKDSDRWVFPLLKEDTVLDIMEAYDYSTTILSAPAKNNSLQRDIVAWKS